ncbi:10633_t:CDS:1 [Acaulospora morrowiae]|uniref:10633_t:CDS:1 n=1 Tax=Acaulospora morrowiae TaxID=94023 RepID=A0A9N9GGI8_9GLOM|nr:10633_t:CDS:1 [Acaulospora morrowiae]
MELLQPSKSSYTKASDKAWFTYAQNGNEFQQGLLGLTDSYIAGSLCLQFPKDGPLKAKKIEVSITGTEYVRWTEQVLKPRFRDGRMCQEYETEEYKYEQKILDQSLILWKSEKESYEEITTMDLPFQIQLPKDLPPSMDLEIGKIYYQVKANFERKSNFWKLQGSHKSIKCMCLVTRYSPMPEPSPMQWIQWIDQEAWKRGLGYNISMNHDTFGPANPIIVNFAMKILKQGLKIKEVFVGLKEYREFRADNHNKSTRNYIQTVKMSGDQFSEVTDEWAHEFKINVLENEVNWTTSRHHIDVYHCIKIKIKFGLLGPKNVNIKREIKIENISDVKYY